MSTLGKVLVILVVLSLLGWIFLAALVADHHMNWSKRHAQAVKDVEDVKAELPAIEADAWRYNNEARVLQVDLDKFRRNFRTQLAMEQKEESETKETLSRLEFQLKAATSESEAAARRHDVRSKEKADLDKAIAVLRGTVEEQMADNKKLKDQFQALQQQFLTVVGENKGYVDRLNKKAAANKPRTRLGSMVR